MLLQIQAYAVVHHLDHRFLHVEAAVLRQRLGYDEHGVGICLHAQLRPSLDGVLELHQVLHQGTVAVAAATASVEGSSCAPLQSNQTLQLQVSVK